MGVGESPAAHIGDGWGTRSTAPSSGGVSAASSGPCLQSQEEVFQGNDAIRFNLSRCILFCSSPPSPLVGIIIFLNLFLIEGKLLYNIMLVSAIKQRKAVIAVVQSLSCVRPFATPRTAARQASLSFTISQSLLKLMSIESVMPSNHLILCRPFSSCLQSFPASGSFPMSQLSPLGGQSIGASASASVLPMNIQTRFPLGWTG